MIQTINKISELRSIVKAYKKEGKTVGFVPTMGYLHDGHISLVKRSVSDNDITVVSIFVNPTQFGPNEDLSRYPRDFDRDKKLVEEAKADIIFFPDIEEIYPESYKTYVEVYDITNTLCGSSRPGHFKGVTTVVAKLFNIVSPDNVYFGQKDAQQALVIEKMVRDLDMDLNIIKCPIVREKDGLAMSSRNVYLSPSQREQAPILNTALLQAKQLFETGERNANSLRTVMEEIIGTKNEAKIDYVSIVDTNTLEEVKIINDKALIALAVFFGKTRLIDNINLEV